MNNQKQALLIHGEKYRFKKGHKPWNAETRSKRECLSCNNIFEVMKREQKFCCKGCATSYRCKGKPMSYERRIKFSLSKTKAKEFTGFKSSLNKRLRNSVEWKIWRERVFKRDNYICQICNQRGGTLEPHHIIMVKECIKLNKIELIFEINNGRTLCYDCHKLVHKTNRGD